MEIRHSTQNGVTLIELEGRLDQLAAPDLENAFSALVTPDAARVLVDMTQVEYISSGGLRVVLMMLKATKKISGVLKLCGMNPFVKEVFQLSNLLPLFDVFETRQEALDAFGKA